MFSDSDSQDGPKDGVGLTAAAHGAAQLKSPHLVHVVAASHDAALESTTPHKAWPQWVRQQDACTQAPLGKQQRPLYMVSACSGVGSHSAALRALGVTAREVGACDPKDHAYHFRSVNGLEPEHHFDNIASMVSGQGFCKTCRQKHSMWEHRIDLFVCGYPCQPSSTQRHPQIVKFPPADHRGHGVAREVVAFLRRFLPLIVVLENTPGVANKHVYDGELQSGLSSLEQQLSDIYAIEVTDADTQNWVGVRRGRKYIFMVLRVAASHADAAQIVRQVAETMRDVESQRRTAPPESLQNFLYETGDAEWGQEVLVTLSAAGGRRGSGTKRLRDARMPKWTEQCDGIRQAWREQGRSGWNAHPLRSASFWGVAESQGPRAREIAEVFLLQACELSGDKLDDQIAWRRHSQDLFCNVGQNPSWLNFAHPEAIPVVCTSTRFYCYRMDRLVTPGELMRAHGWREHVSKGKAMTMSGIAFNKGMDLVGECMALQNIGTALWAVFTAARSTVLLDVWRL